MDMSYPEAVRELELMSSPAERNPVIRELAAGAQELVSWQHDFSRPDITPNDRGPMMLSRSLSATASWRRMSPTGSRTPVGGRVGSPLEDLWAVPSVRDAAAAEGALSAARTAAGYDAIDVRCRGELPTAAGLLFARPWALADRDAGETADRLTRAVTAVAAWLNRVKSVMGPRTADRVRAMESLTAAIPAIAGRAQAAAKSHMAYPSTATEAALEKARTDLGSALSGRTATDESGWPVEIVEHDGCIYGPQFGAVPYLTQAGVHLRCMASYAVPQRDSGLSHMVFGSCWEDWVSTPVRRASWHLARSRKEPGLWR